MAPRAWALTGTPGVGKTSLVTRLRRRGITVFPIEEHLEDAGVVTGRDRRRGARLVDVDALDRHLAPLVARADGPVVIEGHLSHHLSCATRALVIRLRPSVLERRLRRRGWSREKVRENTEAEAVDVILQEAVARLGPRRVGELDATGLRRHELATLVAAVLRGDPQALKNVKIGTVDWTAEILRWY
jgi:adenylate kinase